MPQHPPPSPSTDINTVHVAYRPGVTDRGHLYLHFRTYAGFELFAFYDHYCFVRFVNQDMARQALLMPSPEGIITLEPAQKNYRVPYPQPEEDSAPCKAIHVTHLPTNYSKDEMCKVFRAFPGFLKVQFHGKYGYVFFEDGKSASTCWRTLRLETNLVVSYAKNAKLEDEEAQQGGLMSYGLRSGNHHSKSNPNISNMVNMPPNLSIKHNMNAANDFYRLRSKLHNIPASQFANGLDEPYTFLPRDSVRQLDADLKDDFEQLLIESNSRLGPQSFGPGDSDVSQPSAAFLAAFPNDEHERWISDPSCDHGDAFLSDADSTVSGLVSPAIRSRRDSASSPEVLQRAMNTAPWDLRRRSSYSSLMETRSPTSPQPAVGTASNGSGSGTTNGSVPVTRNQQQQQQQQQTTILMPSLLPKPAYYLNPMVPEFLPSVKYQPPSMPQHPVVTRRGSFPTLANHNYSQQSRGNGGGQMPRFHGTGRGRSYPCDDDLEGLTMDAARLDNRAVDPSSQHPHRTAPSAESQQPHSLLTAWELSPPFHLATYRAPQQAREAHVQIA
ncbi:hypothetical protein BDZ88DRAFT_456024 [Geranomyces variabilis]|nr:hypothetical protein BDZ88DRAFT_456024 [Geranomyces variabilis]KAJ3133913.1 hypothetical protein HDU90_005522 [Geranomyces variabilis]